MGLDGLTIVLRYACVPVFGDGIWGDMHFGRSLHAALRRRGHRVIADYYDGVPGGMQSRRWRLRRLWTRFRAAVLQPAHFDLMVAGRCQEPLSRRRPTLMWLIHSAEGVDKSIAAGLDHIFVASSAHAARMKAEGLPSVSFLPQATDPALFSPDRRDPRFRTSVLCVCNDHLRKGREAVTFALEAGYRVTIWGLGWSDRVPAENWAGPQIANADLGIHYASADVVINDHVGTMKEYGFTSNRVFDVLASATPLVSDLAVDLEPEVAPFVYLYSDRTSFKAACEKALNETPEMRERRLSLAALVRDRHSFDRRAEEIEQVAREILQRKGSRRGRGG